MNGGQLAPDGSTIWREEYRGRDGCLKLYLYNADHREATHTTTQLCQRIRASREIIEGTKKVIISFGGDGFDNDVEAVANVLHSLPRFNELIVSLANETVVLLRNAPKSRIRKLDLVFKSTTRSALSELEQRAWPASLQHLRLFHANLDDRDCRTLGRALKQRQGGEAFRIEFGCCRFPSLAGFLVVADALFDSGPFSFRFFLNKVSDGTIPSSFGSVIHGDFYSNLYERKKGNIFDFIYKRKVVENCKRFNDAATKLLTHYSDFYRRLALLRSNKTATFQDWMDALCHDDVRDNVDLLFHLVRTNPGVYFGKDCPGENTNNDGRLGFVVTISCVTMLIFAILFPIYLLETSGVFVFCGWVRPERTAGSVHV